MNKIDWLWKTGAELYRTKWIRDWGEGPSETLEKLLSKLSPLDITLGFSECIKMAQNGSEWPPVPITFISLCKNSGIDVNGSFCRFIERESANDLSETVTRNEIGYNCRSLSDEKARKLWTQYYKINFRKMKDNKLKNNEEKLLTEHVARRPTDIMIDNFKQSKNSKGAKLMQRLEDIKKRNNQ